MPLGDLMTFDNEAKLVEKLKLVEALFAGAATDGEREAAATARERIRNLLESKKRIDEPIEYKFTLGDMWSRKLFVALLRRYGIRPYRYKRQRYTTVMARVPVSFVEETLWPEFKELSSTLSAFLDDVTNRVISNGIYSDHSEAEVMEQTSLPL